jgi:hypothetical protein
VYPAGHAHLLAPGKLFVRTEGTGVPATAGGHDRQVWLDTAPRVVEYVPMYVCIIHTYVFMHACIYVCMYIYTHTCVCVCVCVWVCVCV